jgi:hypothetical protein
MLSCWIPVNPIITTEVLRKAIENNTACVWKYRCSWQKTDLIDSEHEEMF